MLYEFIDIMSKSWGNLKAILASEWTGIIISKRQKMAFNFVFNSSYNFDAREKFIK